MPGWSSGLRGREWPRETKPKLPALQLRAGTCELTGTRCPSVSQVTVPTKPNPDRGKDTLRTHGRAAARSLAEEGAARGLDDATARLPQNTVAPDGGAVMLCGRRLPARAQDGRCSNTAKRPAWAQDGWWEYQEEAGVGPGLMAE